MTKHIPEEPNFIRKATLVQKWLAGIAVSMFFVVWMTGWEFVVNIFRPDFIKALTYLRMSIALIGIGITSVVGYQQIRNVMDWLVDSWQVYKKISEYRKNNESKD